MNNSGLMKGNKLGVNKRQICRTTTAHTFRHLGQDKSCNGRWETPLDMHVSRAEDFLSQQKILRP